MTDTERLDWLFWKPSIREAIDAAVKKEDESDNHPG